MQAYFHNALNWQQLGEKLTESLPSEIQNKLQNFEIRVYPSVGFALVDSYFGLKSLFAFKKNAAFIKSQDPFIDLAMKSLASQGMAVSDLHLNFLGHEEGLKARMSEALNKETCFVSYAYSDPLFAKSWDVAAIESYLQENPYPRVRVDYLSRPEHFDTLDRNTVHIVGLTHGMAAAIVGERVRFRSHYAPMLPWADQDADVDWNFLKLEKDHSQNFFAQLSNEFSPLFEQPTGDRIVAFSNKIDGQALIVELQKLALSTQSGADVLITTPSLSHWGGLNTMDWVLAWGLKLKDVRGTIIVDQKIISDKFIGDLKTAYVNLLELQNGHK